MGPLRLCFGVFIWQLCNTNKSWSVQGSALFSDYWLLKHLLHYEVPFLEITKCFTLALLWWYTFKPIKIGQEIKYTFDMSLIYQYLIHFHAISYTFHTI